MSQHSSSIDLMDDGEPRTIIGPSAGIVPMLIDEASAPEWRRKLVQCLVITGYANTLDELSAPPGWKWWAKPSEYHGVTWDQQQNWALGLLLPTMSEELWGGLAEQTETIAAAWNRLNTQFKPTQAEISGYYRFPTMRRGEDGSPVKWPAAKDHLSVFEQRFILLEACGIQLTDDMKVGMFVASLPHDWDLDFISTQSRRSWAAYRKSFKWITTGPQNRGKHQGN